jgi:hypothetical protein
MPLPKPESERQRCSAISLRHSSFSSRQEEINLDTDVFRRVLSKEVSVDINKSRPLAPQLLQLAMRNNHGDGFASTSQFDFGAGFCLVHDFGEI